MPGKSADRLPNHVAARLLDVFLSLDMTHQEFDIAIIGAGAAGLHLALAFSEHTFFADKKILLLDKDRKESNDRTWCFWEKGSGRWDSILTQSWSRGDFFGPCHHRQLELHPYRYNMLRAADFYAFAKNRLSKHPNFTWQQDAVQEVVQGSPLKILGSQHRYAARWVFDSRVPDAFPHLPKGEKSYTHLLQHFKGWYVRTDTDRFDPGRFTMMDYRVLKAGATSFTYVLPLSRREALVEFTLFSGGLLAEGEYDQMLRQYFDKILKIKDFEISEVEWGVIPMSDFDFGQYSSGNHIRIGTGGGWVKPSSGYAFKNCERNARRIAVNLASGRPANKGLFSRRFQFYDSIFLGVLGHENALGPRLFETMYTRNDVQKIFAFLDEETSLPDDLSIISSFPKLPFLRALGRYFNSKLRAFDAKLF
jgi:lycopene beta-cyclase